jgi:hypothetical protein
MKKYLVQQDLADWEPMLAWLRAKESKEPPLSVTSVPETV